MNLSVLPFKCNMLNFPLTEWKIVKDNKKGAVNT